MEPLASVTALIDFPDEIWLVAKESREFSVGVYPLDADDYIQMSWSGNELEGFDISWVDPYNPSNKNLIITGGIVPGDVHLYLSNSDQSINYSCLVHVCYHVTAIEFEDAQVSLLAGGAAQLTANVTARTQSFVNKLVAFSSSDESVARVDENGVVTAVAPGTATITAAATASSEASASCTVTVREPIAFTLPASLTVIGEEAFAGADIEMLVLQDNITSIGKRAFADCEALAIVHMPDSIDFIADDAFEGCKNITFVCDCENAATAYAAAHKIRVIIQ